MKLGMIGMVIALSFTNTAIALPDMPQSDLLKWSRSNQLIAPLLRPSGSELDPSSTYVSSERNFADGKIFLTVFLNNRGVVTEEALDYRPACYFDYNSNAACRGTIRFEKADRGDSKSLIQQVWGRQVLSDFLDSKLIESFTDPSGSVRRWYQGKLYNYETSHYQKYTINHFIVVSKQLSQADRIQYYKYCANNPDNCGP